MIRKKIITIDSFAELKKMIFGRGAKYNAKGMVVLEVMGFGCLIVGIIGDAINKVPGLEPTNWLLLGIAFLIASLFSWLCAYFAAKEG